MDGVCAANRLHTCFRKPEVLDLAFLNQVLHRTGHIFDWYSGINAMLIKQIDGFGLESLERCFGNFLDMFRPAIGARLPPVWTKLETEFGGYQYLIAKRSERFAHKFFVCERAVRFSRVEESYAAFDSRANQGDHLLLVCSGTIAIAHTHAAQAKR